MTVLSASNIYAKDYFSNARRIYSEGRFFEASIEFERAIFYEEDSNRTALCKYYKSLCYKGLADYDKALEELRPVNLENLPDTLWFMVRYEQAVCSYLASDINQAIHYIDEIKTRSGDSLNNAGVIQLNIICLNAKREWESAQKLWDTYLDNLRLNDSVKNIFKNEVNSLYNRENIPRSYSQSKAKKLSAIIPGSGQIYCGAVPEGLFNFLINASLLGYTIWEFYTQYYLTGYFIGSRFFKKFYIGGIVRADNLAEEKNRLGISKFNSENSSLMLRIYDP